MIPNPTAEILSKVISAICRDGTRVDKGDAVVIIALARMYSLTEASLRLKYAITKKMHGQMCYAYCSESYNCSTSANTCAL